MNSLESPQNLEQSVPPAEESSFGDVLRQFEAEHHNVQGPEAALEGTVLSVSADGIVVDVGRKMEGVLRGDLTAIVRAGLIDEVLGLVPDEWLEPTDLMGDPESVRTAYRLNLLARLDNPSAWLPGKDPA